MSAPTTFNLTELLGAATLEVKGEEYPTSNLAGKVVAFYFSAGWCQSSERSDRTAAARDRDEANKATTTGTHHPLARTP